MSDGAPFAKVSAVIPLPEGVIRSAFFDTGALIRAQPHHGMRLEWVEHPDRVRQEVRALDRAIQDELRIERRGDDHVRRFSSGPNAGGEIVTTFTTEPGEAAATRVEVAAFAPKDGFTFGLGRLSPLGMERVLRTQLAELAAHVTALATRKTRSELPTKVPDPAPLERAGVALARLGERERLAQVATLLEAASLVAIADGEADATEREVLDAVARALCGRELDEAGRARLVDAAHRAAEGDGIRLRCEKLGARLARLGRAELGLVVAVLVAEATRGIDAGELEALHHIARGAGLAEAAIGDALRAT